MGICIGLLSLSHQGVNSSCITVHPSLTFQIRGLGASEDPQKSSGSMAHNHFPVSLLQTFRLERSTEAHASDTAIRGLRTRAKSGILALPRSHLNRDRRAAIRPLCVFAISRSLREFSLAQYKRPSDWISLDEESESGFRQQLRLAAQRTWLSPLSRVIGRCYRPFPWTLAVLFA